EGAHPLLPVLRVELARRHRDAAQERVPVLRREGVARDIKAVLADVERRRDDHGLREDAAERAVLAREAEDEVRRGLVREPDEAVVLEELLHRVERRRRLEA